VAAELDLKADFGRAPADHLIGDDTMSWLSVSRPVLPAAERETGFSCPPDAGGL
jgi:hypothetical protein